MLGLWKRRCASYNKTRDQLLFFPLILVELIICYIFKFEFEFQSSITTALKKIGTKSFYFQSTKPAVTSNQLLTMQRITMLNLTCNGIRNK
uniref:Uncharacterized protein n=1 Tax=Arundo donax TaxID=35708 RepID=A0A0A9CL86_ARUDO